MQQGVVTLAAEDPARYALDISYVDDAGWFETHDGLGWTMINKYNADKAEDFDRWVRQVGVGQVVDVAMYKYCFSATPSWSGIPVDELWDEYRTTMEALERDYPDVVFVWWTLPLVSVSYGGQDNDQKAIFNGWVRDYVNQYEKVLFDIADIESDGGRCTTGGYEALCDEWTDDGKHLNDTGCVRTANALWHLWAEISQ
jgi:hypothetical protein